MSISYYTEMFFSATTQGCFTVHYLIIKNSIFFQKMFKGLTAFSWEHYKNSEKKKKICLALACPYKCVMENPFLVSLDIFLVKL